MKREPVVLSARQRATVRRALKETCKFRGWKIYAINIRTNHVHVVVVGARQRGPTVLNAIMANATRLFREHNLWQSEKSPWADKGSTRYLWNAKSIDAAYNYVEFRQGDDLPEFD